MLESLFIMLFVSGLILTVIAIMRWEEEGDLFLWGMSFVIFVVLMAQAIYIEVPFIAATNATNYTTGNQQHMELGVGAICLGFVLIDIIAIILEVIAWRDRRRNQIAIP